MADFTYEQIPLALVITNKEDNVDVFTDNIVNSLQRIINSNLFKDISICIDMPSSRRRPSIDEVAQTASFKKFLNIFPPNTNYSRESHASQGYYTYTFGTIAIKIYTSIVGFLNSLNTNVGTLILADEGEVYTANDINYYSPTTIGILKQLDEYRASDLITLYSNRYSINSTTNYVFTLDISKEDNGCTGLFFYNGYWYNHAYQMYDGLSHRHTINLSGPGAPTQTKTSGSFNISGFKPTINDIYCGNNNKESLQNFIEQRYMRDTGGSMSTNILEKFNDNPYTQGGHFNYTQSLDDFPKDNLSFFMPAASIYQILTDNNISGNKYYHSGVINLNLGSNYTFLPYNTDETAEETFIIQNPSIPVNLNPDLFNKIENNIQDDNQRINYKTYTQNGENYAIFYHNATVAERLINIIDIIQRQQFVNGTYIHTQYGSVYMQTKRKNDRTIVGIIEDCDVSDSIIKFPINEHLQGCILTNKITKANNTGVQIQLNLQIGSSLSSTVVNYNNLYTFPANTKLLSIKLLGSNTSYKGTIELSPPGN